MNVERKKHKCEVPSVAMGDIAFNLLIFFVILAKANDDSHLNWVPAPAKKVEAAGASKVSIVIDTSKALHLNGQPIGVSQLGPRVKELLGEAPAGDRVVLLKVDKEAQAGQFEAVIEAVSEAGGELVHILEERRE
jgi:biopolymer transport protein ExbD